MNSGVRGTVGAMPRQFAKPPLVEAIVELHWELSKASDGTLEDPRYPLFAGALYERLNQSYPFVEKLAASEVPDKFTPHVVKLRARRGPNQWPVYQVGPGVCTLNFTKEYHWGAFSKAAAELHTELSEAYAGRSGGDRPRFTMAQLRYLNAFPMDREWSDSLKFLKDRLHSEFRLPESVTSLSGVRADSTHVDLAVQFRLDRPVGTGLIKFTNGTEGKRSALIGELHVKSDPSTGDVPQDTSQFVEWLEQGHNVIETWFLELIKGELHQSYGDIEHAANR